MVKKKWIVKPERNGDLGRRKIYELTPMGREILRNEVGRLRELVKHGKQALSAMQEVNDEND